MKQVLTLVSLAVASIASQAVPVAGNPTTYNAPVSYSCVNCASNNISTNTANRNASVQITTYDPTAAAAPGTAGNMGTTTSYTWSNYVNTTTVTNAATGQTQANAFKNDAQSALSGAVTTYANFLGASSTYLANEVSAFNTAATTNQWTYATQAAAVATTASGAATVVSDWNNWSGQVTTASTFFDKVARTGFACLGIAGGGSNANCGGSNPNGNRNLNDGSYNVGTGFVNIGAGTTLYKATNSVIMSSTKVMTKINPSISNSTSTGTAAMTWDYGVDN